MELPKYRFTKIKITSAEEAEFFQKMGVKIQSQKMKDYTIYYIYAPTVKLAEIALKD